MCRQKPGLYCLVLLTAIVVTIGCDTNVSQEDIQEQQQNVTEAQDKLDALKERHQVEDDMETQLGDINDEIAKLMDQASDADGDREVKLRGEIAMLETKYEQAQERLRELQAASGDKWAQLRIKADESWKDVSDSVKQKVKEWNDELKDNGETEDNGETKKDSDE